jgi:hypothetical protein
VNLKEIDNMATLAQIQELEKRRAEMVKKISAAKKSLHGQEKAAETHVKAAIGGAVLALLHESKCPAGFEAVILARADFGVQKQGLGREKFEALKARFAKKPEEQK